jgi:hypothetical protein
MAAAWYGYLAKPGGIAMDEPGSTERLHKKKISALEKEKSVP